MHQPYRSWAYDPVQMGELIEDMSAPGEAAGLPDRAPKSGQKGSKYGWVWHCSLRNEDSDPVLSDVEWRTVAQDVLDRTGIAPTDDPGGCGAVGVLRLGEEARHHADRRRGQDRHPGADAGEIEKATRRIPGPQGPTTGGGGGTAVAVAPPRVRLQAAATKRGTPEFLEALRAQGLRVHENHGPDRRLRGDALEVVGDTDRKGKQMLFGGRTLPPDLWLPKLPQRWDSAPMPEVTLTPTRLSRVSAADEVAARRTGQAAVEHARTALAAGTESAEGIAHATSGLLTSLARATEGAHPGAGAAAAEVYDRAARTPGVVQPNQWGHAAQGLRMASWQIALMGMFSPKGRDQNAATVALFLALGSLAAEIAASHQDAHRVHHAAAATKTSTLLRTHPTVLAPPPPDLAAGMRRLLQRQAQQAPQARRAATRPAPMQRPPTLQPPGEDHDDDRNRRSAVALHAGSHHGHDAAAGHTESAPGRATRAALPRRLQQRRARRPPRRHPRAPGGAADERGRAPGVHHPSRCAPGPPARVECGHGAGRAGVGGAGVEPDRGCRHGDVPQHRRSRPAGRLPAGTEQPRSGQRTQLTQRTDRAPRRLRDHPCCRGALGD